MEYVWVFGTFAVCILVAIGIMRLGDKQREADLRTLAEFKRHGMRWEPVG